MIYGASKEHTHRWRQHGCYWRLTTLHSTGLSSTWSDS